MKLEKIRPGVYKPIPEKIPTPTKIGSPTKLGSPPGIALPQVLTKSVKLDNVSGAALANPKTSNSSRITSVNKKRGKK